MSRNFIAAFIALLVSCTNKQGSSFTVEGTVKNSSSKMIYLELNSSSRPLIVDSSVVSSDGAYKLSAGADEENLYSLRTDQSPYPFAIIINDANKINVAADLSKLENAYTVTGSAASQELRDFDKKYVEQNRKLDGFYKHYMLMTQTKPTDSFSQTKIDSAKTSDSLQFEASSKDLKEFGKGMSEKTKSPALAQYILSFFEPGSQRPFEFTRMEWRETVTKSAERFPDNRIINEWKQTLRADEAPDFTMQDTGGKAVSLSSFKGKYVLIDFWASWCKPCRYENPNVVAAYNQFRHKNFTVLGVSLDESKDAWLKAIETDGLTWTHVSDLKGWENAAAALYGVKSIPYNVLLDPKGNIVAEDVRGKELFTSLEKFLK